MTEQLNLLRFTGQPHLRRTRTMVRTDSGHGTIGSANSPQQTGTDSDRLVIPLAAENPGLVHRMVISNSGLPDRDPALTISSRGFPQLLPTCPDNPMYRADHEAWKVLERWTKPVLTIFSDTDVVAPQGWEAIVARVPGAQGQPHVTLKDGGHFVQEDIAGEYTKTLLNWLGAAS